MVSPYVRFWNCDGIPPRKCGASNRSSNKTCNKCGKQRNGKTTPDLWRCGKCKFVNFWKNDYCGRCGKKYTEDPSKYQSDSDVEFPLKCDLPEEHNDEQKTDAQDADDEEPEPASDNEVQKMEERDFQTPSGKGDQRYYMESRDGEVEAWSNFLIPFENRSEKEEGMRDELTKRISEHIDRGSAKLGIARHAILGHQDSLKSDLENVLFYNTGCWNQLSPSLPVLLFERVRVLPVACPQHELGHAKYYLKYFRDEDNGGYSFVRPGETLLSTTFPVLNGRYLRDPIAIWARASEALMVDRNNFGEVEAGFSLKVTVFVGEAFYPLTFPIKTLIDGIITSLHQHNGIAIDEVASRASKHLGLPPQRVRELLTHRWSRVLGQRQNLRPRKEGLRVDPDDARLAAAELRLVKVQGEPNALRVHFEVCGTL